LVFVISFGVIFAILNGRFFIANAEWSLGIQSTGVSATPAPPPADGSTSILFPPLNPERLGVRTTTGNAPIYSSTGTGSPIARIQPTASGAVLSIGRIGVSAPIVFDSGSIDQEIYNSLERGVVHYPGTPKPGEGGASIILGHSSAYPWYRGKYGSVFALLGKLQTGDKIRVEYADGRTFTYNVTASIIFSPSNDSRLTQIQNSSKPTLVLISCWPIGTNYKRIAIQAELIQ